MNYRSALMSLKVYTTIIDTANRQLQRCKILYNEQDNPNIKKLWHFCFWYLKALSEYEECVL
jgi:hypothetical protein